MNDKAINPYILERRIYLIRGQKVMIDADLADLYNVTTKSMNQAVQRNKSRFPFDFMFQLTTVEYENLRSQFVTSSLDEGYGGRRYLPYVFTEHGVAMLSSVLKSQRAMEMNISIIRAFIKLREMLSTNKELANKMEELEHTQRIHGKSLATINSILKQLMEPDVVEQPEKHIGFNK